MDGDGDLRAQLSNLSTRLSALEESVGALRDQLNAARTAAPPGSSYQAQAMQEQPVAHSLPPVPRPRPSLEDRIGGQLLNRLGILAVLTGVAWFLKLAFDRNWIGPPIRVLLGLLLAAVLTVWSERFRRRNFPAFSYSLKALGTGIAYLSLWAASSVFHLAPTWLVFLAMFGVTAANAVLAWVQQSELLAMYALAGGLATPALLPAGLGNEVFLFSYLTLLNVGALLLLALHGWSRIAWAALAGTGFYYLGWTLGPHAEAHLPVTEFFVWVFFSLFAAAPFLILRWAAPGKPPFLVAFPIANVTATWVAFLLLYGGGHNQPGTFWVTLLLGLACLGLAWLGRRSSSLSSAFLGLGVFLAAAAIPLQFHDYGVTLVWFAEALLWILLASTWNHAALRTSGLAMLMVAGAALLLDWMTGTAHPLAVVWNMHFATALVGAAVYAATTAIGLRQVDANPAPVSWRWLAGFASVAFSVTLLFSVSLEVHHYWFCGAGFYRDFCTGYGQLERRSITAGFCLSAWWMVYGAALMAAGFWRRSAFVRWQALAVLGVSIGKVFLNGVSLESQVYRVLSFLGLGVVLLAISFAYQKDWLRLRG